MITGTGTGTTDTTTTETAAGRADGTDRPGGGDRAGTAGRDPATPAPGGNGSGQAAAGPPRDAQARPEPVTDAADGAAAPLDVLLTDAAMGPLRRMLPGTSGLRLALALGRRPAAVAGRARDLAVELGRVVAGSSELTPGRRDKRFADPGWRENPVLRRVMQAYLASAGTAQGLVGDAELGWGDAKRVGFSVDNLVDALAPSNNPALNPTVLKAMVETGGTNLVRGLRRLVADMSSPPRVPTMVEPDAFTVGEDLALTPGAVVLRTPVFELLEYRPATPRVREVPLLVVPPTINKYYVTDLAPGRSLIEHLVAGGQRVFVISWRNPQAEHAGWGLDTYGAAMVDAMDAVERITGCRRASVLGLCSGGIIASMVLAHLAHVGELDRVAALALAVTVLDQEQAGLPGALLGPREAELATRASARRGYLDGRALAEVFAWLRP
ncbi:MAG TPA: alpha/beta fold hydrolase, partial [Pseudonocardia sp.]|nr:alpha/beta fold hydrolase [Pseudonocardia sp.]